jgi:alpha-ketoglutarate-dependent taurine dioxygenase
MDELILESEQELMEFAYRLGQPISSRRNGPIIDELLPLTKVDAHPQSLSVNFGTNSFPFHTDGAYFKIPPRFIILRYVQGVPSPTPTLLCDLSMLNETEKLELQYGIWKVKSRTSTFYSSILSDDAKCLRYDPCIMSPINEKNDNSIFFEQVVASRSTIQVNWQVNKAVVIDNWRYLHTRPKVKEEEIRFRKLQRIMVL